MTKNEATAQSWSTPAHSPTHLSDTTDSVSLSYWLLRRTYRNCQGGGLTVASARDPGVVCPCWHSPTACGHSQGVALPHRLSHAAGLFSPFTWLETIGSHYGTLRVLRPAGRGRREVRKSVYVWTPVSKMARKKNKKFPKCTHEEVWIEAMRDATMGEDALQPSVSPPWKKPTGNLGDRELVAEEHSRRKQWRDMEDVESLQGA